jgi:hypothetical protein
MKSLKNLIIALSISLISWGSVYAQDTRSNENGEESVQIVLADTVGINIQNKNFVYVAKKMKGEITLDGVLDEEDWLNANQMENFRLVTPVDSGYPYQKSTGMITYDDKALYIATIFYDTIPGKRIMESFRRDYRFNYNDNLLTVFDTFRDQTNAYTFGSSPSGAIWDGIVTGSQTNLNWDSKIEVEVKNYSDKWITEIKVPFRSLRYPKDSKVWYVNFGRLDLKTNQKSAWAPVPRQFPHASPAYTGVLIFDELLPEPRLNFSLIPYVLGGYHRDFEANEEAGYRKSFGFDAKIGFTTSTNLDLTYNPDFAQVEVDQQQMNLDRFELFFPEKRQFFLEIRRDRGIELAMEGFRFYDLMRWKRGELLEMEWNGMYVPAIDTPLDLNQDGTPDVVYYITPPATTPPYPAIPVSETYGGQPNPYKLREGDHGEIIWLHNIKRKWEDKNYYYPIPETHILTNPNLTQNPGWE